jgi:hypothetical protein
MKVVQSLMYQFWAARVTGVSMRDTSSIHYYLYPISVNLERMQKYSGSSDNSSVSPIEASDLLYQISLEDFQSFRKEADSVDQFIKETLKKPLPYRVFSFFTNKEYRHMNFSRKSLHEKERFIKVSSDYLKSVVKSAPVDLLPVGVASNVLFASARLGLAFGDILNDKLFPLLDKKIQHLHALGLAETLWALAVMKADVARIERVLKELQRRKIEIRVDVVTSPLNHLEYIRDPEPEPSRHEQLLNNAADLVTAEGVKKSLRELASKFKV